MIIRRLHPWTGMRTGYAKGILPLTTYVNPIAMIIFGSVGLFLLNSIHVSIECDLRKRAMQDPDHFSMPLATLYEFYAYFPVWGMHGEGHWVLIFNNFFCYVTRRLPPGTWSYRKLILSRKFHVWITWAGPNILLRDQKDSPPGLSPSGKSILSK